MTLCGRQVEGEGRGDGTRRLHWCVFEKAAAVPEVWRCVGKVWGLFSAGKLKVRGKGASSHPSFAPHPSPLPLLITPLFRPTAPPHSFTSPAPLLPPSPPPHHPVSFPGPYLLALKVIPTPLLAPTLTKPSPHLSSASPTNLPPPPSPPHSWPRTSSPLLTVLPGVSLEPCLPTLIPSLSTQPTPHHLCPPSQSAIPACQNSPPKFPSSPFNSHLVFLLNPPTRYSACKQEGEQVNSYKLISADSQLLCMFSCADLLSWCFRVWLQFFVIHYS